MVLAVERSAVASVIRCNTVQSGKQNSRLPDDIHLWARFPGTRTDTRSTPFGAPAVEMIIVDRDDNADLLVPVSGELHNSEEVLVVIVNSHCRGKDRLIRQLRHLA